MPRFEQGAPDMKSIEDDMWRALPAAWAGTSAGVLLALFTLFWRLRDVGPVLVVRYGEDHAVWSVWGELVDSPSAPAIPFYVDALTALLVFCGIVLAVATSWPWWAASRKISQKRKQR